jgi:RNA recognition motif-containing protein
MFQCLGFVEAPKKRIYISNVNDFVTEKNLLSIFEAFGKVEKCILIVSDFLIIISMKDILCSHSSHPARLCQDEAQDLRVSL